MNEQDSISFKRLRQRWVSRRNLIRGVAGATLGTAVLRTTLAYASRFFQGGENFEPFVGH